jgi:hypothetical protein
MEGSFMACFKVLLKRHSPGGKDTTTKHLRMISGFEPGNFRVSQLARWVVRTLISLDGSYIGTGPLSTASPSSRGLYTLCGQPASSLPPLNEVINVLPSPRAGTQPADGRYLLHPPTPQQPLPIYRRFIAAVAFPPLPHNSSVLVFPSCFSFRPYLPFRVHRGRFLRRNRLPEVFSRLQ